MSPPGRTPLNILKERFARGEIDKDEFEEALVHGSFIGDGVVERRLNSGFVTFMPFKHNASRRHRIGKMKFQITNWRE